MGQINLTWIEGKRFLGIDSTNHGIVLSPPNDVGAKPSDMLLVALASCAAIDVVEIIHKQRATLYQLHATVEGEQASEAPWAFQRIHVRFTARANNLRADQFTRALDLAINKYCSVRASLDPAIAVTFEAILEENVLP